MRGGRASFMGPHVDHSLPGPGPAKKRKRNVGLQRHWDDPEQQSNMLPYDDDETAGTKEEEEDAAVDDVEDEEESRELMHGEIWDDSALIAAWESATAEYEFYHGKGKDWKKEPVKKSPLLVFHCREELRLIPIHRWYNVPPDPSKLKASVELEQESDVAQLDPEDSRPLDFATFVPDHDPSLAQPPLPTSETYGTPASGEHVGRDEAFNLALGAMYWAGYWTAVYHSHGRNGRDAIAHQPAANGHLESQGDENADEQDEDEELLISTQR
ncbi:hypothetical protein BC826DRAFT_929817 [Russula brevipes]|nr:hypothetical protein BC826DRAFT_929817 [Russula brevipes]